MAFFSERELGEVPRTIDFIDNSVWDGISAIIRGRVDDGSFGSGFPSICSDGSGPTGTDEIAFWKVMKSEIPSLKERPWLLLTEALSTISALDIVEFCWRAIGKPVQGSYHKFFDHHHLRFDVDAGRADFREAINRIFRRNGISFQLNEDGQITRLAPKSISDTISTAKFCSHDRELDQLLDKSRRKFLEPDLEVRREALEALWDAWERLKTLGGCDKKTGIAILLDMVAAPSSPKLRASLEQEAINLTNLGNQLRIRHSETDRETINSHAQVDYLYHRLFSMIDAILRNLPNTNSVGT